MSLSGCPREDGTAAPTTVDAGAPATGWVVRAHPCQGGRTDALLYVGGDTFYVGCGSGAEGRGLWRSDDAGSTWGAVEGFGTWRVSDLSRAPAGDLFVAGIDTASRVAVARYAPEDGAVDTIWMRTDQVDESFHVGHFARLADGRAVAESLTGGGLVARAADDAPWAPVRPWSSDGVGHQILDLAASEDAFFAVGSTIIEPPTIFVPATSEAALFDPVRPLEDVRGELWALALTDDGLLAVGVDQDADRALLLQSGPEPGDAAGWRAVDVTPLIEGKSWLRGACAAGSDRVAVGERQPLGRGTGRVLRSADAGATWFDDSPAADAGSWSRCVITDDGRLVVAGADGGFAIRGL